MSAIARNDPWRYVTPCCGTTSWEACCGRYRCVTCREHFGRLRDKKTGKLVVGGRG